MGEKEKLFEKEKVSLSEIFKETISEEYRKTWNYYFTAKVLRNIPNLMNLDDHEIYDDFGFDDINYKNKKSFEYFFSEAARYCYYKYQKQLWENVNFDNFTNVESEHHFHIINGVGIFIQDFRGCFTWLKEKNYKGHFLGKKQYEDFMFCFGHNGMFEKLRCSLYISANPLVFFSKKISETAALKINDALENWSLAAPDDQISMLETFRNFRERTQKNLSLVSGDVHMGCMTNIYKNGEFVLQQMITSPICQKPPTNAEFLVVNLLLNSNQNIKEGYTFIHHGGFNDMNYGIIDVRINPTNLNSEIYGKHVSSNDNIIKDGNFDNMGFREEIRGCVTDCGGCHIL